MHNWGYNTARTYRVGGHTWQDRSIDACIAWNIQTQYKFSVYKTEYSHHCSRRPRSLRWAQIYDIELSQHCKLQIIFQPNELLMLVCLMHYQPPHNRLHCTTYYTIGIAIIPIHHCTFTASPTRSTSNNWITNGAILYFRSLFMHFLLREIISNLSVCCLKCCQQSWDPHVDWDELVKETLYLRVRIEWPAFGRIAIGLFGVFQVPKAAVVFHVKEIQANRKVVLITAILASSAILDHVVVWFHLTNRPALEA